MAPVFPTLPPDVLAARARRLAALVDFDVVAGQLDRMRRRLGSDPAAVDAADLVAAEARTELARTRFWDADTAYQALLTHTQTG